MKFVYFALAACVLAGALWVEQGNRIMVEDSLSTIGPKRIAAPLPSFETRMGSGIDLDHLPPGWRVL